MVIISLILLSVNIQAQKKEYDKALKLHQEGKPKQALKWLDKSIAKNPSIPFVHHLKGACHFDLELYENALNDFQTAKNLEPKNMSHAYNVGLCYQMLGNYSKSCETYSKSLELTTDEGQINLSMAEHIGTAFYFCNNLANAEKYLKLALRLGSEDSVISNNLAWTYTQTGKYKEAIRLFKDAYELDPTQYQNVNNLGYAYYLDDQLEKAEDFILEAKKLNPENSFVYRNLGLIRMKQNNKTEACEYLQQALDLKIIEEWGEFYVEDLSKYCHN